ETRQDLAPPGCALQSGGRGHLRPVADGPETRLDSACRCEPELTLARRRARSAHNPAPRIYLCDRFRKIVWCLRAIWQKIYFKSFICVGKGTLSNSLALITVLQGAIGGRSFPARNANPYRMFRSRFSFNG